MKVNHHADSLLPWLAAIVLWLVQRSSCASIGSSDVLRNDICVSGSYGAKRFYLEEGESGLLTATVPSAEEILPPNRSYLSFPSQLSITGIDSSRGGHCSVELNSCPSCSITIRFKFQDFSRCRRSAGNDICGGCDYVTVKENIYTNPVYFCSDTNSPVQEFRSIGRSVFVSYIFSKNISVSLTLEFSVIRNAEIIYGEARQKGVVKSPFFPNPYPRDYSGEVKFQAKDSSTLIRINFEDYQLTPWSFIEIFDSNSSRSHVLTGNSFRPPIITSRGNSLIVRFYANGGRATGFKYSYEFISVSSARELSPPPPVTGCGGWVDNTGGAITMMNMTSPNVSVEYDCLWLIKPQVNFQIKSNLAVRVSRFTSVVPGTILEIRQGLTSDSPLMETMSSTKWTIEDFVVPWDTGFYIRLRGSLTNEFRMALVYSTFTYSLVSTDCFSYADFLCHNHRCIHSDLRCDGFDHCGDSSDEPAACNTGMSSQDPSWWYTHTPNYYFPKSSELVDIGATTFILLTATLGVVVFVASLIALLFRMSSHTRLMRERQARIEFLHSQLVANESTPPPPVENPPCYEAPPDYAEILKINEIRSLESEFHLDSRLRVLLPPTPVPVHRDSESLHIAIISTAPSLEGLPGLETAAPGGSQASTPSCRSRGSTPRRKARRHHHKGNLTPRKCPTVIQENVPTSPPPPYEISDKSVFTFEIPAENSTAEMRVTEKLECSCLGACACSNLTGTTAEKTKPQWRNERGNSMPGLEEMRNRSLDIYFSHNDLNRAGISSKNESAEDDKREKKFRRFLSLNSVDRPHFTLRNKLWKSFSWPYYSRRFV